VLGVVVVIRGTAVRVSNTYSVCTDDTESNWPIHADVNYIACVWSGYEDSVGEIYDCSDAL
jgi:hypothetical protein